MTIKIITDSASDLTPEEIEDRGIYCVPMEIGFGDRQFVDGVDIDKKSFYKMLIDSKEFPKTSQPSPAAFLKIFNKVKEQNQEAIVILVSGDLSGTVQSATMAKEMCDYEKIYIIDSKSATVGIQILVDRALELCKQGMNAIEIKNELETLKLKIKIYAGLDTLENLQKGGRLSKTASTIGTIANLKPIVTVMDGKVKVQSKAIGLCRACKQIADIAKEDNIDESFRKYILYSHNIENSQKLKDILNKNGLVVETDNDVNIGATIGTHIGVGAFGMAYVVK